MKILIGGGSGFIGQHLTEHFSSQGHEVSLISRTPTKLTMPAYTWEKLTSAIIQSFDVVINLAGANIGEKRWSKQRKREILDSRITTTQLLANLCSELGPKAPRLLNASAIGVYGLQENSPSLPPALTETTPIDFNHYPDFLAEVGRQWEKATWQARDAGCSVVNLRFAVVIDQKGGAFKRLATPFYFGLGGPIGSGKQPFCWVALTDVLRAIDFLINHPEITGPINIAAPQCLSQKQAAKIIGQALHRPSLLPTPGLILKWVFGQMAEELLLHGQCAYPKVLLEHEFHFNCETLTKTLT